MPFLASFSCLWCGAPHATRAPDDLEGWAQLCPDCLGRAGENPFLRFRLRDALAERAAAGRRAGLAPEPAAPAEPAVPGEPVVTGDAATPARAALEGPSGDLDPEMVAYYEARAGEYDDWYLRRGRYRHGPIDDMAWGSDLETAGRWLDGLGLGGRIVELATGTGWWSPLLAGRGELWCYDAAEAPLELARQRLVAHGLRAHLHVRDAWAEPEFEADALFMGFWLSHVPRPRLGAFLTLVRRWLKPGGALAFIDSRHDPSSSAVDHRPGPDVTTVERRLADGRSFTIPKVFYRPAELEAALAAAGFEAAVVGSTARFFLLGSARAGGAGAG
jgi:demethylmenaquinone methyltransferase/2-methoxy-6-polyprenyl-1,4-benzoquinol methylase